MTCTDMHMHMHGDANVAITYMEMLEIILLQLQDQVVDLLVRNKSITRRTRLK